MRSTFPVLRFLLLMALVSIASRPAPAAEPTMAEIMNSVVAVHAEIRANARTAETLGPSRTGSGVVIGADGLILTIGYLILEAENLYVLTRQGTSTPADFVAYDHDGGFGLLRARQPLGVKPLPLGDSEALKAGAKLLVVSVGLGVPVTPVAIASRRTFVGYWEYLLDGAIFTMPPHQEHGGAALIDQQGRLVGIGSLLVNDAPGPAVRGVGNMFVPVDVLKPVLAKLVASGRTGRAVRPWLGLYSQEFDGRLTIVKLAQGGPAAEAGLRRGDVILGVSGRKVASLAELYRAIHARGGAGVEVPLDIMRHEASDISVLRVSVKSADRHGWLRMGN
ncbi:MAG: S1C family serine protease [Rhodospirillaceae bacterium]